MTLFAITGLALLVATPPTEKTSTASTLIEKLFASGRRQAEPFTWALLDAYARAPTETLRAAAAALVRRCDNSVTEEALHRILKQNPRGALTVLAETAPPSLCVVRAVDALNRHPRLNASVGATLLLAALDSVDTKIRLAALDALSAPAFANDLKAIDEIRSSPRLAALVEHVDSETRFRGTALVVSVSDKGAPPHLSKLLAFRVSRRLSIRQRTQEVLAELGRDELRDDFTDITECVGAFQAIARLSGFDDLRRIHEKFGASIAHATRSENAYCRIFAYEHLGAWHDGPDVCGKLKSHLRKEKVEAVRVAMRGACFQRAATAQNEKWLAHVLTRSPNRFHKAIAGRALLHARSPTGRNTVIAALKARDRDVRWIAAQTLVDERHRWARLHKHDRMAGRSKETVRDVADFYATMEALVPAVADPDWYVRNNAALALQEATGNDFGTHAKRWKAFWVAVGRTLWETPTEAGSPTNAPSPARTNE
ncbi:MAG: hypothetical protein HYY84_20490 [Deltaproteobacteria bacterium]|nr:hypothetical protein [Deltaproteobacteria bacterium]